MVGSWTIPADRLVLEAVECGRQGRVSFFISPRDCNSEESTVISVFMPSATADALRCNAADLRAVRILQEGESSPASPSRRPGDEECAIASCRVCLEDDDVHRLVAPCSCTGSMMVREMKEWLEVNP